MQGITWNLLPKHCGTMNQPTNCNGDSVRGQLCCSTVCKPGYGPYGFIFCNGTYDGVDKNLSWGYFPGVCAAFSCTCPSGTATLATGTVDELLCKTNNAVDCSACDDGFTLHYDFDSNAHTCIGEQLFVMIFLVQFLLPLSLYIPAQQ